MAPPENSPARGSEPAPLLDGPESPAPESPGFSSEFPPSFLRVSSEFPPSFLQVSSEFPPRKIRGSQGAGLSGPSKNGEAFPWSTLARRSTLARVLSSGVAFDVE